MPTYSLFLVYGIRKDALDPESRQIAQALKSMGFAEVESLSTKKGFETEFSAAEGELETETGRLVEALLKVMPGFSPVLHDVEWELKDQEGTLIKKEVKVLKPTSYLPGKKS